MKSTVRMFKMVLTIAAAFMFVGTGVAFAQAGNDSAPSNYGAGQTPVPGGDQAPAPTKHHHTKKHMKKTHAKKHHKAHHHKKSSGDTNSMGGM